MPEGNSRSLPKGCWRSISTMSCRRPRNFQYWKPSSSSKRVAAKFFDRITAAFYAVLVHQHHDVFEIRSQHVRFVTGHFRIEQQ